MEYPQSSPADQRLAFAGRQRFAEGMVAGIPELDKAIAGLLSALSQEVAMRNEATARRDAWLRYQEHRQDWARGLQRAWREAVAAAMLGAPRPSVKANLIEGLELLSDDVVENDIVASRMALTVTDSAGSNFEIVRLRTQRLMGQELPANDVLRPDTLCKTLVTQWIAAGMLRADLQVVVDPLQRKLAEIADQQYQALNKLFEAQGVASTNDFRARVRRTTGGATHPGGDSGMAQVSGYPPTGSGYVGHMPSMVMPMPT